MSTIDPTNVDLSEADAIHLRRAIELSMLARERGNRPFGSVIVSVSGEVLSEGYNTTGESGDCTGHAELAAIRTVSPLHSREVLASATIYAIFWSNIRRVVFGIDAVSLRVYRGERPETRDAELSCRDVFNASPHSIAVVGPALIDEARLAHVGAWKS
jgi:tRNA(adenine34) deaminase